MRFRRVLAVFLAVTVLTYAHGNTFTKVRYNGGSLSTTVKPDDWDNKLTVDSESIVLALKDGQTITILPKQVTSLSYGQEAHRRVGTAVALAFLSLGVGALFALHKTKLHFIGINYTDSNAKKQGLLLQGDKSNFRAIIVALQGVTGVPVSVSEKERDEIPAGVAVQAVKEAETAPQASAPNAAAPTAPSSTSAQSAVTQDATESVAVTSNPDGGEIYVDDSFMGNAPATLKLKPGSHKIRVSFSGYKDWTRDVTAQLGTEAHITATLEKAD
jgi:hypothetical protein